MGPENCSCEIGCTTKAVVSGVIIGILAAIFRYTALITVTPAFLWVLFGIAIVYLGITLITSYFGIEKRGCCDNLSTVIAGILGTVLTSVILLGITFAATSVIGAVITGLLLFFFTLLIVGATCLIKCRSNCE